MKSIYGRVKKAADPVALPVMVHGDKLSNELHAVTERIINVRLGRVKTLIDSLKLSAAYAGSYSLSANQIGVSSSVFVIHKEILDQNSTAFKEKLWLHPLAYEKQEEAPMPDNEKIYMSDE